MQGSSANRTIDTPQSSITEVWNTVDASRRVRHLSALLRSARISCELQLPSGKILSFGNAAPAFRVCLRDERGLRGLDELSVGRAYVEGAIDIQGDLSALFDLRDQVVGGATFTQRLQLAAQLFLSHPTRVNRRSITDHYTFGDDFYLQFVDKSYRFYSHCLFEDEGEPLEQAALHKLESMFKSLRLAPGMRLLDIGGGWGGVTEYCGAQGIHVTALTLVEESARYIRRLIDVHRLPGAVYVEDFLEHRIDEPYDHAVIYGVIEHIPNYRPFCERLWDVLKPGGRLYLDASATVEKFDMSAFTRRYIWHGPHTFLALQDMLTELLYHGFEIVEVRRETRDYELTISHWAARLDANHDVIAARWGEDLYRAFRLYLWGGAHAFRTNRLQAYHLVAEKRNERGPRPGHLRRLKHFLRSLR